MVGCGEGVNNGESLAAPKGTGGVGAFRGGELDESVVVEECFPFFFRRSVDIDIIPLTTEPELDALPSE